MLRKQPSTITPHSSIRSILTLIQYNSWVVLDLDNTVIEPLHLTIGSDQWFTSIINIAAEKMQYDKKEASAFIMALYREVQEHVRAKPVEADIVKIIKTLQDIGIPVIALTARDQVLARATYRQLEEIGIHLRGKIIFCDGKNKGRCLTEFLLKAKNLAAISFPAHIVMADDKIHHLEDVREIVVKLGIRFDGIHYQFLEEKVKKIDMDEAHAQLAHIKHRFTTSTQRIIEILALHPSKPSITQTHDNAFYLPSSPSLNQNGVCPCPDEDIECIFTHQEKEYDIASIRSKRR